jgi:hypothetical protein
MNSGLRSENLDTESMNHGTAVISVIKVLAAVCCDIQER